jgi:uncharacterized membrane-anchored protein YhcB (DUF1043 family)
MEILGFEVGLGDLVSLGGAGVLGFIGKALGGWRGYAVALVAGLIAGAVAMGHYKNLQADRQALVRERVAQAGLRLIEAASDAAEALKLAEKDRVIRAVAETLAEERAARDDLEAQLEALRGAPREDDRELSPTAQRFFDGLRGE